MSKLEVRTGKTILPNPYKTEEEEVGMCVRVCVYIFIRAK